MSQLTRVSSARVLAYIGITSIVVLVVITSLKWLMGDASDSAERVRLLHEANKVIEYVTRHGDLPRNANGLFDPSMLISEEMHDALVFNPLMSVDSIRNKDDSEVLAATSPEWAQHDPLETTSGEILVQFVMANGDSNSALVEPKEYADWCDAFSSTDVNDKNRMNESLPHLLKR